MRRRWTWLGLVMMALVAALCGGARAAATHYEATLQADGQTLGSASGTLDITRDSDGRIVWKLSEGQFTAATVPHAKVVFDARSLAGSGSAAAAESVTLKEFNAVLAQSTGVDVTYRFRFTVTLDGDAVRGVEIRQMK
jgi:hypothetical protein